jgi:16S rRNA (uracil1498-N3)-methyltransferase
VQLFYNKDFNPEQAALTEEESGHCVRVLRQKVGDSIHIVDGKGNLYKAEITDDNPKRCALKVLGITQQFGKKHYYIHLAIAPTKNIDRMEWMVEKAVEIGVDEITFLLTDRTERRHLKADRMKKIAISAMKQSVKAYLPKVNELVDYKKFVTNAEQDELFIAHLVEGERHSLYRTAQTSKSYCILIGPEGDFSPQEVTIALQNRFTPVTLGTNRLRTETAGIVVCHTLNLINEV